MLGPGCKNIQLIGSTGKLSKGSKCTNADRLVIGKSGVKGCDQFRDGNAVK